MKHDQFSFLEHRREQEAAHHKRLSNEPVDPLNSILTVEVNTTELCNRNCIFCPRHDPKVFPNRNLHMTPKGAESIAIPKEIPMLPPRKALARVLTSGRVKSAIRAKIAELTAPAP